MEETLMQSLPMLVSVSVIPTEAARLPSGAQLSESHAMFPPAQRKMHVEIRKQEKYCTPTDTCFDARRIEYPTNPVGAATTTTKNRLRNLSEM